jgi:exodeoxyribonuclease X
MPDKYLFFDTETTDTQAKDLVQLAFVTDSNVSMNLFVKPIQDISFGAMAIHHITPEMVEDLPYFEEAPLPKENIDPDFQGTTLREYLNFLAQNYVWVAHNADFDLEVMGKKGIEIPHSICTLKLARLKAIHYNS